MSPPQIVPIPSTAVHVEQVQQLEKGSPDDQESVNIDEKKVDVPPYMQDAFGDEEFAEVKYKVLKWWCVLEHLDNCWPTFLTSFHLQAMRFTHGSRNRVLGGPLATCGRRRLRSSPVCALVENKDPM
jgi:hypothetical protein